METIYKSNNPVLLQKHLFAKGYKWAGDITKICKIESTMAILVEDGDMSLVMPSDLGLFSTAKQININFFQLYADKVL